MKLRLRPTRRTRLRLTLLAVLALLFQQVALASYVCASADVPAGNAAMSAHCAGMPMAQQKQPPSLCTQHCVQQTPTTQDARVPTVPALVLPALLPAPVAMTIHSPSAFRRRSDAGPPLRGIPPALRFRVLLI